MRSRSATVFFQAEDGIRALTVTGVQTCALPICLAVQGRDRRLQRVRARAAAQGFLDERQRLGDLWVIPAATVLFLEQDEVAGLVQTGVAPRTGSTPGRERVRISVVPDPLKKKNK